jgi:hypothetical protein
MDSLGDVDIVVLQVVISQCNDVGVGRLQCSRRLATLVDQIHNCHYWKRRVLEVWPIPVDFVLDTQWYQCYTESLLLIS